MVNIVILSWNALDWSKHTIESLLSSLQAAQCKYQITVVDNASTDGIKGYLERLAQTNRSVRLICNAHNYGIAFGYNQGFMESVAIGAEYTVFCNNDLHFFGDGWLSKLVHVMDLHKDIAVLAPLRTSDYDYYSAGLTTKQKLMMIADSLSPVDELTEFMDKRTEREFINSIVKVNMTVFGVPIRYIKFPNAISTCVCMIRTKIFKDNFGYFVNPYFMEYGGDDIDMSWRVMRAGYNCAILNTTYVHHFRSRSLKEYDINRDRLLNESNKKLLSLWGSEISQFIKKNNVSDYEINHDKDYWIIKDMIRVSGKGPVLCGQK